MSSSLTDNQWYLNGNVISGANSQFLSVEVSGFYSVTVTNAFGCTSTSNVFSITLTDLSNVVTKLMQVNIYSNPNYGKFCLIANLNPISNLKLEMFNIYGQSIFKRDMNLLELNTQIEFDLKEEKGIYFMQLTGNDKKLVEIIIIN